jgi:uncharacterized small protein (DUF1192 family)
MAIICGMNNSLTLGCRNAPGSDKIADRRRQWRSAMDFDDIRPVKKPEIVIGEDLSLLSLAELENRIQTLEAEIARIREALVGKKSSKAAADSFFRT